MWEKALPLGLPGKAFQGDQFYSADNLDPVAIISYYYSDSYKSIKDNRKIENFSINKMIFSQKI